jgi:hypothetical protein
MFKKVLLGLVAVAGGALLQDKYDIVGKSKTKIKSWASDEKKDAAAPAAEEPKKKED